LSSMAEILCGLPSAPSPGSKERAR
jgi:hypothetical protein